LFERAILRRLVDELPRAEHDPRDAHERRGVLRDPPGELVDLLELRVHTSRYTRASTPPGTSRTSRRWYVAAFTPVVSVSPSSGTSATSTRRLVSPVCRTAIDENA